jgi:hypothetical protein
VSPIFIRPVREQLEHDRLIRHLATKYDKEYEVAVNVGDDQGTPVKIGPGTFFPDVVLTEGRKLAGLAEVETGESVNNLEAMAQWVHFSKARVPFHLYVPVHGYDAARRLCDANHARVTEIWTYRQSLDGFDLVRVYSENPPAISRRPAAPIKPVPQVAPAAVSEKDAPLKNGTKNGAVVEKPAAKAVKAVVKPVKSVKPVRPAKAKAKAVKTQKKPAKPAKPVRKVKARPVAKAAKAPMKMKKKAGASPKKKGGASRSR